MSDEKDAKDTYIEGYCDGWRDRDGEFGKAPERSWRESESHARASRTREAGSGAVGDYIDIVFDGPPGPESGRFVEVEDVNGKSIDAGMWRKREDGLWALRVVRAVHTPTLAPEACPVAKYDPEYDTPLFYCPLCARELRKDSCQRCGTEDNTASNWIPNGKKQRPATPASATAEGGGARPRLHRWRFIPGTKPTRYCCDDCHRESDSWLKDCDCPGAATLTSGPGERCEFCGGPAYTKSGGSLMCLARYQGTPCAIRPATPASAAGREGAVEAFLLDVEHFAKWVNQPNAPVAYYVRERATELAKQARALLAAEAAGGGEAKS